jgi:hypothetical protein
MTELYNITHTSTDVPIAAENRFPSGLNLVIGDDLRPHLQVDELIGPGHIDIENKDASGKLLSSATMEISNFSAPVYDAAKVELIGKNGQGEVTDRVEAVIGRNSVGHSIDCTIKNPLSGRVVATTRYMEPQTDPHHYLGSPPSLHSEVKDADGKQIQRIDAYSQDLLYGANTTSWTKRDAGNSVVENGKQYSTPVHGFRQVTEVTDGQGKPLRTISIEDGAQEDYNVQVKDLSGNLVETIHISNLKNHEPLPFEGNSMNAEVRDAGGNLIETLSFDTTVYPYPARQGTANGFSTRFVRKNAAGETTETGAVNASGQP